VWAAHLSWAVQLPATAARLRPSARAHVLHGVLRTCCGSPAFLLPPLPHLTGVRRALGCGGGSALRRMCSAALPREHAAADTEMLRRALAAAPPAAVEAMAQCLVQLLTHTGSCLHAPGCLLFVS
jgi:hypothetical protein